MASKNKGGERKGGVWMKWRYSEPDIYHQWEEAEGRAKSGRKQQKNCSVRPKNNVRFQKEKWEVMSNNKP